MGHTVIAVPVLALDDVVRERTAHYDPSFVSSDPAFVHAHITLLAPWIARPSERDLERVGELLADVRPAEAALAAVEAFPGGVIHLRPAPEEWFAKLTAALAAEFPQHPPYAGEFPNPVPHLTLDHPDGGVTLEDVRARVEHLLPVAFVADRVDLQWWDNHDCRLMHSWKVGT